MTDLGQTGAPSVDPSQPSSGSVANPTYWWYVARTDILRALFLDRVPASALLLDVGSADGPSSKWLDERTRRVALDIDPSGLREGGVCASADRMPFPDATFDVVTAFDVVEHFADEDVVVRELRRVVRPGGQLLVTVPAYQWAWTDADVEGGHYRRYTRARITAALRRNGFEVERATYAFGTTLPFFAADRLRARLLRQPASRTADGASMPAALERLLLRLGRYDARLLSRRDLPFGSSVAVAARAAQRPVRPRLEGSRDSPA